MQVAPACDWSSYCRRSDLPAVRVFAHPDGGVLLPPAQVDCALAVGPEGGFEEAEVEEALTAGWQKIGLGDRILRVETAAILLAAWSVRPRLP
jgi:16S rRNA (uracil1498-N3)-methyltransferase